jgi:hypothetical protein
MITNHLLEAKYEAQRRLTEEVDYDLQRYSENAHQRVLEVEQEYQVKFTYAEPESTSDAGNGPEPRPTATLYR